MKPRQALPCLLIIGLAASPVNAGDILRGGLPANQKRAAGNSALTSAAAERARTNAKDALARTSKAIQAAQSLQNAARNAVKGINNLGADPRHPGAQLPVVQDGLATGGLKLKLNPAATNTTGFDTKEGYDAGVASVKQTTSASGGANVTVKQVKQQAFLTWETFNVGKNTSLNFDQSAGGTSVSQWIAFNKVEDPSSSPSQIMGRINAPGQVYIINQNGIIFGAGSQVNLHTLVASSLPVNTNLTSRGLLNNPDAQFLFSSLPQAGKTAAFTPTGLDGNPLDPNFVIGDVTVQPGARISAPTSAAHVGGRVALVGANVTNSGTISTPDGQTILAAGLQVGFTAHSSSDPSLRGLDVFVGAVKDPKSTGSEYAGTATNAGIIQALRGDTTITGKTVNQMGVIDSSTSVSLNGRVDLVASYGAVGNTNYKSDDPTSRQFLYNSSGLVTLGPGSVTRILPEISSTDTVVGTELALPSLVNIQGKVIHLGTGSTILAPGAKLPSGSNAVVPVNNSGKPFTAGVWLNSGVWDYIGGNAPVANFVAAGGQIYVDANALINVAGSTDVTAPISQNILTLQLRGAEFSNSPLNRGNFAVRGVDLTIDIRQQGIFNGISWVGTPLADASGFVGLIQRNVAQLTTAGGTVSLSSGGSVIMQKGSAIDVSGGFVNYQGGMVSTSRVVYGGHIYDISQATPDKVYDGVYTGQFTKASSRWGVSNTYTVPFLLGEHYDPGYIYGMSGGGISITAPSVALDGEFMGSTISGPRQRSLPATPSSLSLNFQASSLSFVDGYAPVSPTPPQVVFQSDASQAAPAAFHLDASGNPAALSAARLAKVVLSPDLVNSNGFGSLTLSNVDGNVLLPAGETLAAGELGSVSISAANIDIEGRISAPGGTLDLVAYNLSPTTYRALLKQAQSGGSAVIPAADPRRGAIILGSSGSLSTAGLLIDDRLSASSPLSQPLVTTGGSISLTAYNANLQSGGVIDVSGGVVVDSFGKRTYGNAGAITINAGQDPNLPGLMGGHLTLGATLKGYAGGQAQGGSLSVLANAVQIGGSTSAANVLVLQPDFFNQGGFSTFSLQGLGKFSGGASILPGLVIAPGTEIDPVVQSYIAAPSGPGSPGLTLMPVVMPEGMRSPVNLSFGATTVYDDFSKNLLARGDLVLGQGAVVNAGPLGSVTFSGGTVAVYGSAFAPGGIIKVAGASSFPMPNKDLKSDSALTTVYLAPGSVLSAAGKVILTPDAYGRTVGTVLGGGSISVSGNIVAEAGSVLDVSGTSGSLDIAPAMLGLTSNLATLTGGQVVPASSGLTSPLYSRAVVRTEVDSSGGSITLKGGEALFTHASLLGEAGGPTATGGTLSIQSGAYYPLGVVAPANATNLVVTQTNANIPSQFFAPGQTAIGKAVLDGSGKVVAGQGYFAVSDFVAGGFDSLTLGGSVDFSGPVNISARAKLLVATSGIIKADSVVNLSANYVALGQAFAPPIAIGQPTNAFSDPTGAPAYFAPTFGTGVLNVTAKTIDIGNLSLQGIGSARLIADNGDIRGDGTLDIAGSLYMRAAQIYPLTATTFTIAAYDYMDGGVTKDGSVTIAASGVKSLPLSAGGTLNIFASEINQGGTLRAPFGIINLGWDGTGTSPVDNASGAGISSVPGAPKLAVTKLVNLLAGSITSVSAIDPITGAGVLIPYGTNPDGKAWIDPAGNDITTSGLPVKAVNFSSLSIDTKKGSVIDIRGGGDLFAYRWVTGQIGTHDILASTTSFAVIPGYNSDYAPFGAFNTTATNLQGDTGYTNSSLKPGDQVYLGSSKGLPAGVYTLLPARYALLPGAFLVTPGSGTPIGTFLKPDGASYVNGYRFNDLNGEREVPQFYSRFEVAPASTVAQRAQYDAFAANDYISSYAAQHNLKVQPLPEDSGKLVLSASSSMILNGSVKSRPLGSGLGGRVDISSPEDIEIASAAVIAQGGIANTLLLDAAQLSAFGADSLLIGGVRTIGANGTTVIVKTGSIKVDNAGSALTGSEIILAANNTITLADDAVIKQTVASTSPAETLLLGSSTVPGSGRGVLLRVSSDPAAQIVRTNLADPARPDFTNDPAVNLVIGNSAVISGRGVIIDSTSHASLAASASITGSSISLDAGQISVQLADNLTGAPYQPTNGSLLLTNSVLGGFKGASSLSLLSYSSIDIFGGGSVGDATLGSLALHAAQIRGFDIAAGDSAVFTARNILIDNSSNGSALAAPAASSGTLSFNASTIHLGVGQIYVDQYSNVQMNATAGLFMQGKGGFTARGGSVAVDTPFVTAAGSSVQQITAAGGLSIINTGAPGAPVTNSLGGSITLQGASVNITSDIILRSGQLTVSALAGNVTIGGKLDVSGSSKAFNDLVEYTNAGSILISSNTGNVDLSSATLNVSGGSGGDAGSLSVAAAQGTVTFGGVAMSGAGGKDGKGGAFSLDVASLGSLSSINSDLDNAGFNLARSFRVRTGDVTVDGSAKVASFRLSADQGAIDVTGKIDASGLTGGSIFMAAYKGLTLEAGALLDVSASSFSSAGKGGSVDLETRGGSSGIVDLKQGSTIDLGVYEDLSAPVRVAKTPGLGQFTGTLHLRAPQNASSTDLAVGTIGANVLHASSIIVEGYKVYTPSGTDVDALGNPTAVITKADQDAVRQNGETFLGKSGDPTLASYTTMLNRLVGANASLLNNSALTINVGAEFQSAGEITLGNNAPINSTTNPTGNTADWDLHTFRFGPNGSAGVLTLRAGGNLLFLNGLSDGFTSSTNDAALLAASGSLPLNAQSWSYRLVAGADLSAVDFRQVASLDASVSGHLAANAGSLELGKSSTGSANPRSDGGALTSTALVNAYQVIRTGSGDIDISAGRDVRLLNQFATIYTAGTQVPDPTMGGTFDTPQLDTTKLPNTPPATDANTAVNHPYPAQYSLAGGEVNITAQNSIYHAVKTIKVDSSGNKTATFDADSERELPNNWIDRRGYVDPLSGEFYVGTSGAGTTSTAWSTTWWVDFSNFFEGVGALGGGNVNLKAGTDIINVDAAIPTNARMPRGVPDASRMVELGGGNLTVRAGRNIDAGVYYVERGRGSLGAGGSITTNSTRSATAGRLNGSAPKPSNTWLPTTLFLGRSSFDVTAGGDLLLGPAANVFLQPESVYNTYWDKTYFSTYDAAASVNVQSLGGNVTIRTSANIQGSSSEVVPNDPVNLLYTWMKDVQMFTNSKDSASWYQPWLRLNETTATAFLTTTSILPGTLKITAFDGDVNLNGSLTLSPSPVGSLDLLAAGSINGLQITGSVINALGTSNAWSSSRINISDADPALLPGVASPLAYQVKTTVAATFATLNTMFNESGSTTGNFGVVQTKQALHASGLLHENDAEPVHLYADDGDISGITLFSPKETRVVAGQDITDISLYLQNNNSDDVSVVASGRDIVAYDANSALRSASRLAGNLAAPSEIPLAGDIQINGPGVLEVLAGRNLDLGSGANKADGTGVGITSIGNGRNPNLPFDGASIIAAAGIGPSFSLGSSGLDFDAFIAQSIRGANGARYLSDYAAASGSSVSNLAAFNALSPEEQKRVALEIFFIVLRDAGRDHNLAGSPGFGNYTAGEAAVSTLFGGNSAAAGDITTQSRDIRTKSGGDISIIAPSGSLTLANSVIGSPLAPPGIITESGGNISIMTKSDVDIGISRIFTLRGGNEIIWSSAGSIAAGSSSKTVQSAPPTRVLVDPQSGDVKTDLAGLATGGGIGVLATVVGVPPGSVDLIAPTGSIDAGDAGIRATGNLNIAAVTVLNASNISVGGATVGAPAAPAVAAPNVGGLTSASTASVASTSTAPTGPSQAAKTTAAQEEPPSVFTVEVIGYGGGEGEDEEDERKRKRGGGAE